MVSKQELVQRYGKKIIEEAERETRMSHVKDVKSTMWEGDPVSKIIKFGKKEGSA